MSLERQPRLHTVAILDLRPTQITVGMREVETKRTKWRLEEDGKRGAILGRHLIPVIQGPKDRFYVIDHHHLCLALHLEGEKEIAISIVANLSKLEKDAFFVFLDNRSWMHPFDDSGVRRGYRDLPKSATGLIDDPFRSLAGALRQAGGYSKETTPFSEFLWADFLRRNLKRKLVEADFNTALDKALDLAKGEDANYLPGWCGVVKDD